MRKMDGTGARTAKVSFSGTQDLLPRRALMAERTTEPEVGLIWLTITIPQFRVSMVGAGAINVTAYGSPVIVAAFALRAEVIVTSIAETTRSQRI
jgi:hypothetical protein